MQASLIETFLDICETHSFNRTAERLGVMQSTVSDRIKALEKELGRRLFVRSRAGTSLTLEGIRFEPHARILRISWSEALRAARDTGPAATQLRVGIQRDLTSISIVDWVQEFRETLPGTSLYVEANFSQQMCHELMCGQLDIGLIYTPFPHPDLHFETVAEVHFHMISSVTNQLGEVPQETYVLANNSPAFECQHAALLPDLHTTSLVSCGQDTLVQALLTAHGGSGYVLKGTAEAMVANGGFYYVKRAPVVPQTVYSAIHLRNRHRSSHRKLIKLFAKYFPG